MEARVLPAYGGGSLVNLVASLVEACGGPARPPAAALLEPRELERARNVVLVILDGLGDNYLMRQGKGGELARRRRGALTSVFPSTTASAITTSYTGCTPVEHGITGWYTYFGEAGYVAAPLPFRTRGDMLPLREKGLTPERAFTARPIFESMQARAIIVSSAEIIASEYNLYHCAAAERRAYDSLERFVAEVEAAVKSGPERKFVYAYWPAYDATSHRYGSRSAEAAREFERIDAAFGDLLQRLSGTETTVVATADHGFIDVPLEAALELPAPLAGRAGGGEAERAARARRLVRTGRGASALRRARRRRRPGHERALHREGLDRGRAAPPAYRQPRRPDRRRDGDSLNRGDRMKATVNGIETYYEIHGNRNAPTWLVFSHSLACSVRMWDGEIERHKAKHCVLAYDTRGHGQSAAPKGPYTLEALADDLQALLRHLKIEKPHYVGLSMGGMIGQTAALKYPGIFRSMTLADTTSRYPAEAAPMWEERIRTAESKGMAPLVQPTLERWFTEPFRKSHPEKVKQVADLSGNIPVAGYAGCCAAIPKINVTARLKEIKTPALVICGENDPGTPPAMAREIQQNLPGAKLTLIPQAAHLSNIEQPEAFNRALGDFLSSLASG